MSFELKNFDVEYFNVVIAYYRLHHPARTIRLEPLVEALKIKLKYRTLTPHLNGIALIVPGTGERVITVKSNLEYCWQRYVLGHEIAHIFQYQQGKLLFSSVKDWSESAAEAWQMQTPQEQEADSISAFLYVPLAHLQRELYKGTPFEAIAAQLEIPSPAVLRRYEIALATGEFL